MVLFWIFPSLMVLAALFDFLTLTIPNKLNFAIGALFFAMLFLLPIDADLLINHASACVLVFIITFIFYGLGWIGGGDSKMASVIALWIGLDKLLEFLAYTALAGGVLSLLFIVWNFVISYPAFANLPLMRTAKKRKRVPYGIALAIGGIVAYLTSVWTILQNQNLIS